MANTPAKKNTPNKVGTRPQSKTPISSGRPAGLFTWVAVGLVVVVIVVIVVIKVTSGGPGGPSDTPTPTSSAIVADLTTIPASVFNAVGVSSLASSSAVQVVPPTSVPGQPTLSWADANGVKRPTVFYYGAEYCPFCGAERWPMIIALSRFGTFTGLYNTFSSNTDLDPSTPTFTFVHSTYTSKYLNFFPVEFASNIHSNNAVGYTLLTTPTKAQLALVTKYDTTKYFPATEGGSIPFVTINNRFMLAGSSYSPSALAGSSHQQIAAALSDSTNPLAQGILTAANLLTASMCVATKDLPANVCVTPAIKAANAVLGIKSSS